MGGSVSVREGTITSSRKFALIEKSDVHLTFQSFPVLCFEDIQSLLTVCADSWNFITERGQLNQYQVGVFNELQKISNQDLAAGITAALGKGKRRQPTSLITTPFKYCIKTKRSNELQFKQKLLLLGREHARIGITSDMINTFVQVLLNAFCNCISDLPERDAIMFAWTANMKFMVSTMTSTSFSFMRVVADQADVTQPSAAPFSRQDSFDSSSRSATKKSKKAIKLAISQTVVEEERKDLSGRISARLGRSLHGLGNLLGFSSSGPANDIITAALSHRTEDANASTQIVPIIDQGLMPCQQLVSMCVIETDPGKGIDSSFPTEISDRTDFVNKATIVDVVVPSDMPIL